MTDTDFLTAICANPADDTPRLVYADWLEEQGRAERADWIRRWIVRDSLHCRPSFAHNMRTCPKCVETDALWENVRKE